MRLVINSKIWDPHVSYTVIAEMDDQTIRLETNLEDFLNAVVDKLGSPTLWMTKQKLTSELKKAVEATVYDIKKASVYLTNNK